ncbi:hypothetical protein ACLB2K_029570 [Fragaria x ananassa]
MSTGRKRGRTEVSVSEEPDALLESDAPVSQTREKEELTPDDANTAKKNDVLENGEVEIHSGPQTGTSKSVQGSTLCVNDLCEVLGWEGTGLVVARGKISAVGPTTKVHGYNLGPNCYRVVVEEAVVPRAEFYRPQPEFSAMEDAVGNTIAWPTKYIVPL